MAIIEFSDGLKIEFDGEPTQMDVEEAYNQVKGIKSPIQQKDLEAPKSVETYGAILPASPDDSILEAGGKAIVNTPSSALNLVKSLGSAALNVFNPDLEKNTVANIFKTGAGAVEKLIPGEQTEEEKFNAFLGVLKERYGSLENLQRTATNDPFGFGTDIVTSVLGGAGAVGKTAQVNKAVTTVAKPVTTALEATANASSKAVPKLLSYTSDVPETAFQTLLERREPVTQAIKTGASPETALKDTRVAVRGLRKELSNDWEVGKQQIIQENSGVRIGMPQKMQDKFENIVDEFGIDLPPGTNLGNLSANEVIDILKKVNELPQTVLTFSPKGAVVRDFKRTFKDMAVKGFGGDKGTFSNFYKNYSSKKSVLDAVNDIVNTYAEGKPIKNTTAMNRLQNVFDENKPAYLEALLDFEKTAGVDILSNVAASKFKPIAPTSFNKLSAAGGMAVKKGLVEKMINILALPLTSPRSAAFIARNLKIPGVAKSAGEVIKKSVIPGNVVEKATK